MRVVALHGTGRRVPESREERVCAAGSKPRPGRWLTTCSRPPRCARSRGGRTPGRFSSSHLERPVRATTGHCEVARGRVSRPGWTGHLGRARGRGSGRTHSPPRDRAGLPCRTAPPPKYRTSISFWKCTAPRSSVSCGRSLCCSHPTANCPLREPRTGSQRSTVGTEPGESHRAGPGSAQHSPLRSSSER